jgi:two-component system KDP operon response regulator KdpE
MSQKKIVIVDDDRDQQTTLRIRLVASGYQVVSAIDAMQAISVVRREKPNLILLDIGLPGGDGHTVIQRLRLLGPIGSIPIIVLSAADAGTHRLRMKAAGAVDYFQKPANFDELMAAIRKALGEGESPVNRGGGSVAPQENPVKE